MSNAQLVGSFRRYRMNTSYEVPSVRIRMHQANAWPTARLKRSIASRKFWSMAGGPPQAAAATSHGSRKKGGAVAPPW